MLHLLMRVCCLKLRFAFYFAVTLLRILECIGYLSISSDDLKHILQLLKVGEDENVVR